MRSAVSYQGGYGMRFAIQYIWEHRGILLMQLLFAVIFAAAFLLYHLPAAAVLYPAFLCLIAGCLYMGYRIRQAYKKHRQLERMHSMHGYTMQEQFFEHAKILEKDYQQAVRKLCKDMQSMEDQMSGSYREMMDYFTVWVHQIKTPIASMRLHLTAEDSKLSRRLMSDLLHIEQYVEMVLTYFKTGAGVSDYVFRTVSLDKILRENIRRLRGDFILKKLGLVYEPSDKTVISDEKWLSFVIEQILSNALKYTNEGEITITVEDPATLCISDTGIGIAPQDLPRIFDKGYTGANGRADLRASGLGLYLCRQVLSRLGHDISISSKVEEGTCVRIDLDRQNDYLM